MLYLWLVADVVVIFLILRWIDQNGAKIACFLDQLADRINERFGGRP